MSAVTLNKAGVNSLLDRSSDVQSLGLDNWIASSRVSERDAKLMKLPAGTIDDVEYKSSVAEASDRELFEALVSRIYGADGRPALRARLLSSPDVQQLWAQWQRAGDASAILDGAANDTVVFPQRLTVAPPEDRPRAKIAVPQSPLAAAFEAQMSGVSARRGRAG